MKLLLLKENMTYVNTIKYMNCQIGLEDSWYITFVKQQDICSGKFNHIHVVYCQHYKEKYNSVDVEAGTAIGVKDSSSEHVSQSLQ